MDTQTIKHTLEAQKEYVEALREEYGEIIDGIINSLNGFAKKHNTKDCVTHIWVGTGIPLTSAQAWHLVKLTELRDEQFVVSGTPDNTNENIAYKYGVSIGRFTHEEWDNLTMKTQYDESSHTVLYTTPEVLDTL